MSFKKYKDESRKDWGTETDRPLNLEQINAGALLRIADAVEKMAIRHTELIRQNEWLTSHNLRLLNERDHANKSNAALRGHIKRMKKLLKETK